MIPSISVIITTYNHADFISDAIDSVLKQDVHDIEVIVVDDGSVDETADIVHRYTDPRMRYIQIEHSGLPASTRNAGIQLCSAPWIAFLDGDDVWLPEKLKRQQEMIRQHPQAALIFSYIDRFSENDGPRQLWMKPPSNLSGHLYESLLLSNFIPMSTCVVRRNVLEEKRRFNEDPRLRAVEDFDLWLRIAPHYEIYGVPKVLALYRIHGQNILKDTTLQFSRILLCIESALERNPVSLFWTLNVRLHWAWEHYRSRLRRYKIYRRIADIRQSWRNGTLGNRA